MKECVSLIIPAKSGYLALGRMAVGRVGDCFGMDLVGINTVRTVVGEAMIYLMVNLPAMESLHIECAGELLPEGSSLEIKVSPASVNAVEDKVSESTVTDADILEAINNHSLAIIRKNVDELTLVKENGSICGINMIVKWEGVQ